MTVRAMEKAVATIRALRASGNPTASGQYIVTRADIHAIVNTPGPDGKPLGWPSWLTGDQKYRAGRGCFMVPTEAEFTSGAPMTFTAAASSPTAATTVPVGPPVVQGIDFSTPFIPPTAVNQEQIQQSAFAAAAAVMHDQGGVSWVPAVDPLFVPWGNFTLINRAIASGEFFPIYITGHTGNGKTLQVEQACAATKREFFRVNITSETEEDDLLGSFQLRDGNTVWEDGPVVRALKRGGVLLLDELDLASSRILCLQSILEGKGVLIKRTGQWIAAQKGFTIIATANTKGRSDESGRYIGTQTQNEAFLERFPVTMEQSYPGKAVEIKIVNHNLNHFNATDPKFGENLVTWARLSREGFENGSLEDFITTRRLCHIAKTYALVKNRMEAIALCVNRFESTTRQALMDLYTKIDAEVANAVVPTEDEIETRDPNGDPVPY